MSSAPWISRRVTRTAKARLFCFPYAGGGTGSFQPWQELLGHDVEVCSMQMPGRGARFMEPAIRSFNSLVAQMADVVRTHADLPFWLVGHSLGALAAYEVARSIAGDRLPLCGLVVSGCEAPHRRRARTSTHLLDDAAFIEFLRKLNGTPTAVLENAELMRLVLPTIRSDFELVESYEHLPGEPLTVPVTVLAGLQDSHVDSTRIDCWSAVTDVRCSVHWFPGDHFFVDSQRDRVLCVLRPLISNGGPEVN